MFLKTKRLSYSIADEIEESKQRLKYAYFKFSIADDPLLIEEAVFEIKSLEAKYSYLLRELKKEQETK